MHKNVIFFKEILFIVIQGHIQYYPNTTHQYISVHGLSLYRLGYNDVMFQHILSSDHLSRGDLPTVVCRCV